MKSVVDNLSPKDKQALALLCETQAFYEPLKKLIKAERLQLAQDHVGQTDILQVRYLSGQADGLKKLYKTLESISQDDQKR